MFMTLAFTFKVLYGLLRSNMQYLRVGNVGLVWPFPMAKRVYLVYLGVFDVKIKLYRVYPVFNEGMGIISVMCHNKKVVFEKYRS